jgi:trehalose/maltose transport system permease protein
MKPEKNLVSIPKTNPKRSWPPALLGLFFLLIGFGAIFILVFSTITNPEIQAIDLQPLENTDNQPSLLMAFLIKFGIILPILTVVIGLALVWLGIKLFSRNIKAARWAQVVLLWLVIGATIFLVFILYHFFTGTAQVDITTSPGLKQNRLTQLFISLILILISAGCWFWLRNNIKNYFSGQELLKEAEVRFAWSLLIPTIAVLIFVAGRPLEQTFIRSLTDKRFAGQGVPNFVGLENYSKLLGVRLDIVDCRRDEETGNCAINPNGSVKWDTIDQEFLKEGYRSVWTIKNPFSASTTGLAISGLDRDFIQSIWTTTVFTVVSVSLELLIGLFIALTVNSQFRGRGLMRAVMLVPWAIPTAISARLWENMLKSTSAGVVNKILLDLQLISEPQAWLAIPQLQIPSAIMVDVWKTAPFIALLLLAGLQTISRDLYEAASVDGANPLQQFFRITLPLLRPTISVALVFRTLDALRVFDLFNVLFSRQQLTMATYNYEMLVGSQKDGYASAISIIIFFLISVFAFLYVRMLNVETE